MFRIFEPATEEQTREIDRMMETCRAAIEDEAPGTFFQDLFGLGRQQRRRIAAIVQRWRGDC